VSSTLEQFVTPTATVLQFLEQTNTYIFQIHS